MVWRADEPLLGETSDAPPSGFTCGRCCYMKQRTLTRWTDNKVQIVVMSMLAFGWLRHCGFCEVSFFFDRIWLFYQFWDSGRPKMRGKNYGSWWVFFFFALSCLSQTHPPIRPMQIPTVPLDLVCRVCFTWGLFVSTSLIPGVSLLHPTSPLFCSSW